MRFSNLFVLIICLCTIAISGCSGAKSPVAPSDSTISEMPDSSPVYVSDWDANGNPTGGMGALGYYTLSLDPEKVSA